MAGGSAGEVRPRIYVMSKSPFSNVPRQENSIFLDGSLLNAINASDCLPLPAPINGWRLAEKSVEYDNFIKDYEDNDLAEPNISPQSRSVEADSEFLALLANNKKFAAGLDDQIASTSAEGGDTSSLRGQKSRIDDQNAVDEDQKEFFTWKLDDKLEFPVLNTAGTVASEVDDKKRISFVYKKVQRAGIDARTQNIIHPFMSQAPRCAGDTVHWRVVKDQPHPLNQPFKVTFHYDNRQPMASDIASNQFNFPGFDKNSQFFTDKGDKLQQLDLTREVYAIIEVSGGIDSHFAIFFGLNRQPMLFMKLISPESGTQDHWFLVDEFEVDVSKKMFTGREMTVTVESAGGNLYIRNSLFFETPWIITPNDIASRRRTGVRDQGIFIGPNIRLWSGNLQLAFSYAPISYVAQGTMPLPAHGFQKPPEETSGAPNRPDLFLSLKGAGSAEQEKSDGGPGTGEAGKVRHMVDAETVTLEDTTLLGNTVMDSLGGERYKAEGLSRSIVVLQEQIRGKVNPDPENFNFDQQVLGGFANVSGILSLTRGGFQMENWRAIVGLISSNVKTAGKFTIPNGRSPYIWLLRQEVPPQVSGTEATRAFEITRDVIDVDITWNTTGVSEIIANGSIRVLAEPRTLSTTEGDGEGPREIESYDTLLDKITYIEIEAEIKNGVLAESEGLGGEGGDARKLFTGCIVGADVTDEPGRKIITFQIEDYMWVMNAVKFQLSPPYDGMFYHFAVADMVEHIGLSKNDMLADDTPIEQANKSTMPYLPILDLFKNPLWKFPDGTSIKDAVVKIAKLDWRIIFFDQNGKFHFDNRPQGLFGDKPPPEGEGVEFFTGLKGDDWDPARLIWNTVTRSYAMKDMYNGVQVVTVVKQIPSLLLNFRDTNTQSVTDANTKGYMGFHKVFRQKDGIFEGPQANAYFIKMIRLLYNVPRRIRFETYGRIGLRPTDVVKIDGEPWRLININLKFNAAKNEFWAACEGEWMEMTAKSQAGDASRESAEGAQELG